LGVLVDETMSEDCQNTDRRCVCGKLLLKRTPAGFELKCSRCKRTVVLPFKDDVPNASGSSPQTPRPQRTT